VGSQAAGSLRESPLADLVFIFHQVVGSASNWGARLPAGPPIACWIVYLARQQSMSGCRENCVMLWMIPTLALGVWLSGLFALALIGGGVFLARLWYLDAWAYDQVLKRWVFDPDWGWNQQTALFAAAGALLTWAFLGGFIVRLIARIATAGAGAEQRGSPRASGTSSDDDTSGTTKRLERPDGSRLHVELYGPDDAPPIVLTHGWGLDRSEWAHVKRHLGDRYRLIAWDLPGLGQSTRPSNNDYSLENLAYHLSAVLDLAGDRPAILLGHSIGGMIALTYCRLLPQALASRVAGLALVHTTYTNPVRTTAHAPLYTALEKPVLVPLLHLTIWLAPLVWLLNWVGYLNGTLHGSSKQSGFAGHETSDQVDWATRCMAKAWPGVAARGMLGMLDYDATDTLPTIAVPALVVPGDQDGLCTPDASQHMARTIPTAQLATLAPARHMGLVEHHERFAQLVDDFAQSCVRTKMVPGRSA
jgi:pimeloyl-ACP methyl ester carboxylesterase